MPSVGPRLLCLLLSSGVTVHASSVSAGWKNQSIKPNVDSTYLAMAAIDGQRATVAGFEKAGDSPPMPTAMYTKDGGQTWNKAVTSVVPSSMLVVDESLAFLGPFTALPIADQSKAGYLHRSTDGGRMFSPIEGAQITKSPLLDPESVNELMASADGQTVWALGETGRILVSRDRGETWEKFRLWKDKLGGERPATPSSFGVLITAGALLGDEVWIAGGDDGELPVTADIPSEADPGYEGGYGFVAHSSDGGQTFELLAQALPFHILDLTFVDERRGWAAGGTFRSGGAVIARTADGGKTWQVVSPPALPQDEVISGPQFLYPVSLDPGLTYCARLEFFGPSDGLALCTNTYEYPGFNGLYRTEDGGVTWEHLPSFNDGFGPVMGAEPSASSAGVKDVVFLDCNSAWAAGTNVLIHRYTADDPLDCEAGPGAEGAVDDDAKGAPAGEDEGGGERADSSCACGIVGRGLTVGSLVSVLAALL